MRGGSRLFFIHTGGGSGYWQLNYKTIKVSRKQIPKLKEMGLIEFKSDGEHILTELGKNINI